MITTVVKPPKIDAAFETALLPAAMMARRRSVIVSRKQIPCQGGNRALAQVELALVICGTVSLSLSAALLEASYASVMYVRFSTGWSRPCNSVQESQHAEPPSWRSILRDQSASVLDSHVLSQAFTSQGPLDSGMWHLQSSLPMIYTRSIGGWKSQREKANGTSKLELEDQIT